MSKRPPVSALASDVRAASDGHLDSIFRGPRDLARFARLAGEVERIRPRDFRQNPVGATDAVYRAAILDLSDAPCRPATQVSWRHLAGLLVGTDPQTSNLGYDDRIKAGDRALGLKPEGSKKVRAEMWERLANAIRDMAPHEILAPVSMLAGEVRRPRLESQLAFRVRTSPGPVVLYGDSGNGKSYLARMYLRDNFPTERQAVVRAGDLDGGLYEADLVRALRVCGHSPESWTRSAMEATLSGEIESGRNLQAVLLDDFDQGTARRLILGPPSALVLLTVRQNFKVHNSVSVHVGAYASDGEALAAARTLLSEANEADLRAMCRLVGRRPILVDIAARLVRAGEIEIEALIAALGGDTVATLDAMFALFGDYLTPYGKPVLAALTSLYRQTLMAVSRNPAETAVLEAVLWLTASSPLNLVIGLTSIADPSGLAARAGLAGLERLGLVEVIEDVVEINDLTLEVLRALTTDRINRTVESHLQSLEREVTYSALIEAIEGSEVKLTFSTGSPDDARRSAAKALAMTHRGLDLVLGTHDEGLVSSGPLDIWWKHEELAAPSYRVITNALDGSLTAWTSNGREALQHEAPLGWGALWSINATACSRVPPPFANFEEVDLFPHVEDALINHLHLSLMDVATALALGIPVWATCGKLVTSLPSSDPSILDCPKCWNLTADVVQARLERIMVHLKLMAEAATRRSSGPMRAQLYNGLFALDARESLRLVLGSDVTHFGIELGADPLYANEIMLEMLLGILYRATIEQPELNEAKLDSLMQRIIDVADSAAGRSGGQFGLSARVVIRASRIAGWWDDQMREFVRDYQLTLAPDLVESEVDDVNVDAFAESLADLLEPEDFGLIVTPEY